MEMLLLFLSAFVMEIIDAGVGMGYGTVLAPLMIVFGYDPLVVVPAILMSQAIGGTVASIMHHKLKNADFTFGKKDMKIVLLITVLGLVATVIGAFAGSLIPKFYVKLYIGILVTAMGIFMIVKKSFCFSWKSIIGVGVIASFNKGISGGGFGPVVTGGQIIAGNGHKSSIGCTTCSEVPICIAGFITYVMYNNLSNDPIFYILSLGACIGAILGSLITKKISIKVMKPVLSIIILGLGIWTVIKSFV